MNDLLGKLKSLDYKSFALKHGEKIGLSLVIAFTLMTLWQTSWGSYQRSPEEMTKLANDALNTLTTSNWPEDLRQQFALVDLMQRARSLETAMKADKFAFNTRLLEPLYPRMQPAEEPRVLAVEDLIVDQGNFPVETRVTSREVAVTGALPGQQKPLLDERELVPASDDDAEYAPTTDAKPTASPRPGAEAPGGNPPPGGIGATDEMRRRREQNDRENEDGGGGPPLRPGARPGAPNRPGARPNRGGEGAAAPTAEAPKESLSHGRGVRYAIVRGVFRFEDQARLMAEALKLGRIDRAVDEVEIVDFEIQRQRATPGKDPGAANNWESLNYETALEILDEMLTFAPDVVRTEVTNNVITMALPPRQRGRWSVLRAGHPRLQQYLLEEEEKRVKEMELNRTILEQAQKLAVDQQKKTRRRPGRGMSSVQRDLNFVRQQVQMRGTAEDQDDMQRRMQARGYSNEGEGRPGMRTPNNSRQAVSLLTGSDPYAIPKLILFRYLDFTVEPGECYRYRVRLEFQNPNYGKSLEKVVSAEVAQNETLKSGWSDPTPWVFIPPDVHVFLTGVPRVRVRGREGARLNVYEWDPKFGTMVNAEMANFFGQFVGGRTKTEVLDPFSRSLGDRETVIRTRQVLIDSYTIPPLVSAENPDLQLNPQSLEQLERNGAFEQAVTVNTSGELQALVPTESISDFQAVRRDTERERAPFSNWRAASDPAAASSTGGLDALVDQMDKDRKKPGDKKKPTSGPEANPLKIPAAPLGPSRPNRGGGGGRGGGGRGGGGRGGGGGGGRS